MYQVIHNLALAAALVALVASLWQDMGLFTAVKRLIISYLGFFFLGSLFALAMKLVMSMDNDQTPSPNDTKIGKSKKFLNR
ncbi:MAG: putative membrane protein YcfT [Candidatus Krumholzibacteriia bacterium]|jgi:uncharacterized membrane protein YcfT